MKNENLLASGCLILFAFAFTAPSPAQSVKRNPDGTVEVYDDDVHSAPAPRAVSRSTAKKGSRSSGASGKIPAYTKRSGGVTIKRNADGTVDIIDNDMGSTPQTGRSSSTKGKRRAVGSVGAYKVNHGDVSVKRNADGTVDVIDTSSTTRRK